MAKDYKPLDLLSKEQLKEIKEKKDWIDGKIFILQVS